MRLRFLPLPLLFAITAALFFAAAAPARAALVTYDITYSGAPLGFAAVGTGQVTLDTSLIANPGTTTQDVSPFVTAFILTISGAGAGAGNGTFGFSDFNGAFNSGGFIFSSSALVDFSMDLAPQIDNFNIFSSGSGPANTPDGFANILASDGGFGDQLLLASLTPVAVAAVPEPGTLALVVGVLPIALLFSRRCRV